MLDWALRSSKICCDLSVTVKLPGLIFDPDSILLQVALMSECQAFDHF